MLDSGGHLLSLAVDKHSSEYGYWVPFYKDDMLPLLLRSLNILWLASSLFWYVVSPSGCNSIYLFLFINV
jgi:hypothetical protein